MILRKKIKWNYEEAEGRWSVEKLRKLFDIIENYTDDENPNKIEITM